MATMLLSSHDGQARGKGTRFLCICNGRFCFHVQKENGLRGYGPAGSHSLSGTRATLREGEMGTGIRIGT